MDVMEIDAASNGLVGDIRALRESVQYAVSGEWRVVLLDEAHSMSREAFNALLKTLEEPPPRTLFVLLTTESTKILPTVLSRCMPFEFKRITLEGVVGRLRYICEQEEIEVFDSLLEAIAERTGGVLREAVMQLDQVCRIGMKTAEQYLGMLGEIDYAPHLLLALREGGLVQAYQLVDEAMSKSGDASLVVSGLSTLVRDLLILQAGGSVKFQGEALEVRRKLAASLSGVELFSVARVLWDFKTRVRVTDDPRSSLELAVVMLAESLSSPQLLSSPQHVASSAPQVLDLQSLQAIALGKG
jgi:DNA polymerase-3 subunit gamma/tau